MRPLGAEGQIYSSLPLASRPAHPGVGMSGSSSSCPTPTWMEEVLPYLCFCFRSQKPWPEDLSSDASFWLKKVRFTGCPGDLRGSSLGLFPCVRPCTARQIVAQRGKGLIPTPVHRARTGSQSVLTPTLPSGCKEKVAIWLVFCSWNLWWW